VHPSLECSPFLTFILAGGHEEHDRCSLGCRQRRHPFDAWRRRRGSSAVFEDRPQSKPDHVGQNGRDHPGVDLNALCQFEGGSAVIAKVDLEAARLPGG
jgi:hypothetical protein